MFSYSVQVSEAFEVKDRPRRAALAQGVFHRLGSDRSYLRKMLFSHQAVFQVSEKVIRR
jgi:DNA-directed RNA polymerase subunit N (RpoN/RPB10)